MRSEEFRNLQAPLKDKYRKQPEFAFITLKAEGKTGEGISCKVETVRALTEAGLHPATGGDGMLACSGDLLLEASEDQINNLLRLTERYCVVYQTLISATEVKTKIEIDEQNDPLSGFK
jgi:uncharacterized OsmC-like protein